MLSSGHESRSKAILEEFDLEVESKINEMEACAQRLSQTMRNDFKMQTMKLPVRIRKMPVAEFCEQYGADVTNVVKADQIKAKSSVAGSSTPGPAMGTKRSRARPLVDAKEGFDAASLQDQSFAAQLEMLAKVRSQMDAYESQIKASQQAKRK